MTKFKNVKKLLCMALAATMLVSPVTVGAEERTNVSVDPLTQAANQISVRKQLSPWVKSITLSQGSVYKLNPSAASTMGVSNPVVETFNVDGDSCVMRFYLKNTNTLTARLYVNGKLEGTKDVRVTWTSNFSSYASVDQTAKLTANRVCKVVNGKYAHVKIQGKLPTGTVFSYGGHEFTFEDDVFATYKTIVVPEEDLSVYFLGVWDEEYTDPNAQHYGDWPVTSSNYVEQLKNMAVNVTRHCDGTPTLMALTKTDNGKVRAYLRTSNTDAGKHYYIVEFYTFNDNDDRDNRLRIYERDYCDPKYTLATEEYFRK